MQARTRLQEQRYTMALGYVYGRKDGVPYGSSDAVKVLTVSVTDFATFYSMYEEKVQTHITLEDAFRYFTGLKKDEQEAYGRTWMCMAYSPYDERQETNRNA